MRAGLRSRWTTRSPAAPAAIDERCDETEQGHAAAKSRWHGVRWSGPRTRAAKARQADLVCSWTRRRIAGKPATSIPQPVLKVSASRSSRRTVVSAATFVELPGRTLGHVVREPPRALGAEALGVAVAVEEVVDDLEEQADAHRRTRSTALARRPARRATSSPMPNGGDEEPPGLEPVELLERRRPRPRCRGTGRRSCRSSRLRAPARPRRSSYVSASLNASARSASPESSATPSPNATCALGATAALVVVVQRRKVVVDEREGVHELEGSGGGKRVVRPSRRPPRSRRRRAPGEPACRPTRASSGAPPRALRAPLRTSSAPRYASTASRSSSAVCIGEVPRLRELAPRSAARARRARR